MKANGWGLFVGICLLPVALGATTADPIGMETQLVDIPTAEVWDRYQASSLTRVYDHGTVMETIDFGVYSRVNIGLSLAVHEWVGSSDSVRILDPDFQAKWKLYDGDLYLPAIAIGYDGRRYGYGYDKNHHYTRTKHYLDDRKGGYISFSREIIVPGLMASAGVNMADFEWKKVYGFVGMLYHLANPLALMAEWDGVHNVRDSRFNAGARFYLHPSLALDAAVRRIGRGNESERILQLRYVTNF